MNKSSKEVNQLFNVINKVSEHKRAKMEELWINWSHLGVEDEAKMNNIMKIVQIEENLHRDISSGTRQQLKELQDQVDNLKEELEYLSRCLSVDITIMDPKPDIMLVDYKKELEEQIAGYREQMEQRRMKMDRLLEWQCDLSDKLGVTIHQSTIQEVTLPSDEELNQLKNHMEELQSECDKRAEIFLTVQVDIKKIMEKLQMQPKHKFEQMVVTDLYVHFQVTDANMERLNKLHQELQEKYEQTNNRVQELREQLTKLWEYLEEDLVYRESFLQAHPGCDPKTESAIKQEITRCNLIKRQKIQVFVANIRTKIKLMWDNIMYANSERNEFKFYYCNIFTEDTLTLHELYLDKITKYYNDNMQLFKMVLTRKNLWLKITELDARASEPNRYQNRGGQLLKEEKERKAIHTNLPKIEAQIRELVAQYEAKTGLTFTIDGKPLLQLMEDEWGIRKAVKHR